MKTLQRDYYKILQVDPEAEQDIIEAAYQALSARFHPENDLTGVHQVRMKDLNRAYEVLSSPGRRRAYDIERSAPYEPMGPGELIGVPSPEPLPEPASVGERRGLAARVAAGPHRNGVAGGPAGATVLDFGRYAGMTLLDIAKRDTEYLRWLSRHSSGIRFRNEIERVLRSVGEYL
ncbi:MAG TPA: DnaJ domain-containing protein [Candidatus Limnocylindria bacterium]